MSSQNSGATQVFTVLRNSLSQGSVWDDPDRLPDFARDESGLPAGPTPLCVCQPRDEAELQVVLEICQREKTPVIARGAGTGKVGSAIPVVPCVILSTEKLRKMTILPDDLIAVVEPGVVLKDLQDAAEAMGLFYPPDPASLDMCTLGGNVASNAGGPRAFRYGATRDYVLGLTAHTMAGQTLHLGGHSSKRSSGYNLAQGLVGSEGTLAIFSSIILKLLPKPPATMTLLVQFSGREAASLAVTQFFAQGFFPSTLELLDETAIAEARALGLHLPKSAASLLMDFDGHPEELSRLLQRAEQTLLSVGAEDCLVAQTASERTAMWQARRMVSIALKKRYPHKISEDVCVPRGKLPALLRAVDSIANRHLLKIACYGHAGDGNLHVNVLQAEPPDAVMTAKIAAALRELFIATIELGGTLSGEHGIGLTKREFFSIEHDPASIDWHKKTKAMWDPDNLLNPGKIFV